MGLKKGKSSQETQNQQQSTVMGEALSEAQQYHQQQAFDQTQTQYQQPGAAASNAGQAARGRGLDFNTLFDRPFGRHQRSEILGSFMAVFQKTIEESQHPKAKKFELIPLDKQTTGMPLSYVLVAYTDRIQGQEYVSIYTLILEGSFDGNHDPSNPNVMPMIQENTGRFQGQAVNVQLTAGDILSEELMDVISTYLRNRYPNSVQVDAGAMSVPHELKPNIEAPYAMNPIWFAATQASFSALEEYETEQEQPFSVGMVDTRNKKVVSRLSVSNSLQGSQVLSATDMPIRSDMRASLEATPIHQGQRAHNPLDIRGGTELTNVDAYVDLVYEEARPQVQTSGWLVQQPQQPQQVDRAATVRYRPRIVVTHADTVTNVVTLELQLLALVSTTLFLLNDNWTRSLVPSTHTDGVDFRDIGAVGYEVNLTGDPSRKSGEAIPTKGSEFQTPDPYQNTLRLLQMVMHKDPLLSIDIEEAGELTWIQDVFMAAAEGNVAAQQKIIAAANNLTNNQFGNFFQHGTPIIEDEQVRLHLGYYNTKSGPRDIRDVDYLAVLNKAGPSQDLGMVTAFSDTFDNTSRPIDERAAERLRIIQDTVGSEVRVTGYARRYTFNPDFLFAVLSGVNAAGLTFDAHNTVFDQSSMTIRGSRSHEGMAFNSQMAQNYFSMGPTHTANPFVQQSPSTRYNRGGMGPMPGGGIR